MDQVRDASDRIADNRSMSSFEPTILGGPVGIGSRVALGLRGLAAGDSMTGAQPAMAGRRPDQIFGWGLPGFALPQVLQPHPRSARAGFAPALGAGRVRDPAGDHREGRGEDNAVRAH